MEFPVRDILAGLLKSLGVHPVRANRHQHAGIADLFDHPIHLLPGHRIDWLMLCLVVCFVARHHRIATIIGTVADLTEKVTARQEENSRGTRKNVLEVLVEGPGCP
jgi:hypothetical protein